MRNAIAYERAGSGRAGARTVSPAGRLRALMSGTRAFLAALWAEMLRIPDYADESAIEQRLRRAQSSRRHRS